MWQCKRPLVSFNQLCLLIAQGSLGVPNPQLQRLIIQIRNPRHIVDDPKPQSLVYIALSHHLSIIAGHKQFNFIPAFREHDLN